MQEGSIKCHTQSDNNKNAPSDNVHDRVATTGAENRRVPFPPRHKSSQLSHTAPRFPHTISQSSIMHLCTLPLFGCRCCSTRFGCVDNPRSNPPHKKKSIQRLPELDCTTEEIAAAASRIGSAAIVKLTGASVAQIPDQNLLAFHDFQWHFAHNCSTSTTPEGSTLYACNAGGGRKCPDLPIEL